MAAVILRGSLDEGKDDDCDEDKGNKKIIKYLFILAAIDFRHVGKVACDGSIADNWLY